MVPVRAVVPKLLALPGAHSQAEDYLTDEDRATRASSSPRQRPHDVSRSLRPVPADPDAMKRVAARVKKLAKNYEPPTFEDVPHPDAALFLAAIDHQTGYTEPHTVDGEGPYEGSALLWALGLRAERRAPGALTARSLMGVPAEAIAAVFRAEQDTLHDPERRAKLWDDLAKGMLKSYGGQAEQLIEASGGKLGGPGGVLVRLSEFDAYSDPLRKKSFLLAKIWDR